jgi:hypothetical protein
VTTTITVHVAGAPRVFNRDRLRTAYQLRLDRQEALRLTLGVAACVKDGVEP